MLQETFFYKDKFQQVYFFIDGKQNDCITVVNIIFKSLNFELVKKILIQ